MLTMRRFCFAISALLCVVVTPADAQSNLVQRDIKVVTGKDARVAVYANIRPDCTAGPLPTVRLVTPPAHGVVGVKRDTLKVTNFGHCLAVEVPAFIAFYRAADGFSGFDEFILEISTMGGRKQFQHFRLTVSTGPGSGEGL